MCSKHGGRAPHIKRAAQARLENAADRLAAMLLGIASDEDMKPETRLAAIKDALDRAGLSARQALDVTVEPRFVGMFDRLERSGGVDTTVSAPLVVDGEVVTEWADFDDAGDGREP